MLLLSTILAFSTLARAADMDVVYEWKYIDYVWNSSDQKAAAIDSGEYNYTSGYTIDVDKAPDGRVFVTTVRGDGVPASLSTVSDEEGQGGPLLRPYPDWSWYRKGDCDGITSVYRVAIDECNRLWVLDTGVFGEEQLCPAQLLAFDLANDSLLKRVKIPNDLSHDPTNKTNGLLVTPIVETHGRGCHGTRVYMADVNGRGLVIWDGVKIWRFNSKVYRPDEGEPSTFTIAGESFYLADGVLGMALGPPFENRDRFLYFRPLASFKHFKVPTKDLHRFRNDESSVRYYRSGYTEPSQSVAQAISKDGIMFFGLTEQISIACWNIHKEMNNKNVVTVAQDKDTLQFASGVKIAREELWVSTDRLQKIMVGSQNFSEINFRVLKAPIARLVKHTDCQRDWRRRAPDGFLRV